MRLPSFTVVSFVVVTLSVFAGVARLLKPLIPPVATNRLANSEDPFVQMGDRQPMDWQIFGPTVFSMARHSGRPIMLVIGTPWSSTGRHVDRAIFNDPEVVNFARRNFVCARIDGDSHSQWLNALLPVARLRIGFQPDWQMWILDPKGRMVDLFARRNSTMPDQMDVIQAMIDAKRKYESVIVPMPKSVVSPQQEDIERLLRPPQPDEEPNFFLASQQLAHLVNEPSGGFPRNGLQRWFPRAWQFLAAAGRADVVRASLDPLLRTPMVDLVDGGFFHRSGSLNGLAVEYDKVTAENAELVALLAGLSGNPLYTQLGDRGFDWLIQNGSEIITCRVGDELPDRRSNRSSFWPSRLRSILPGDERNWAQDHLGLRSRENPQMTPYLKTDEAVQNIDFRRKILVALRSDELPPEDRVNRRRLTTDAFVIARLLEAARRRDDPVRREKVIRITGRLMAYFPNGQLVSQPFAKTKPANFAGCLCFADAALQYYLATGSEEMWKAGLVALRMAQSFERESGFYTMFRPQPDPLGVQDTDVPEVVDNARESASGQAARLFLAYGQLIGGPEGAELRQRALEIAKRFTPLLSDATPEMGGLLDASRAVFRDEFVACVGPSAQQDADRMAAKLPWNLVAAAKGPVRPDLQSRAAGAYFVRGNRVIGPLTEEEVMRRFADGF